MFRLLWTKIEAGAPVGAYVCNRAKDGGYYWVFAIVTPIEGGYISVRLKPGSDLFRAMQHQYEEISTRERKSGSDPDVSLAELTETLRQQGFTSYADFMATALHLELNERDQRLGRAKDEASENLLRLRTAAGQLLSHAKSVIGAYERNTFLPINFQVLAVQLGASGRAMGAVAANYLMIADELNRSISQFSEAAHNLHAVVQNGVFLACAARLQREMATVFRTSAVQGENLEETGRNIAILDQLQCDYDRRAKHGMGDISRRVLAFRNDCIEMKRLSAGLEITRLLGKMESASLAEAEALVGVLGELGEFQRAVAADLRQIEALNVEIRAAAMAALAVSTATSVAESPTK